MWRHWGWQVLTGMYRLLGAIIEIVLQPSSSASSSPRRGSWIVWPWRWRYYNPSKCRALPTNDTVWHTGGLELPAPLLWEPQILYYGDWWLAKESFHTWGKLPAHKAESCFMKHEYDLKLNLSLHGNKSLPKLPNKCTASGSSVNHYHTDLQVRDSGSIWWCPAFVIS
jgi:hypothetical protein